jgi:hypothetical protein
MNKILVFGYKGLIGIKIPEVVNGLTNDPNKINGMLHIVNTDFIEFSQEAIDLLAKLPKSEKCLADFLCYKVNRGSKNNFQEIRLFGFKGDEKTKLIGKVRPTKKDSDVLTPVLLSKDFNHELLVTSNIEISESFKKFVDKLEEEGKLETYSIV